LLRQTDEIVFCFDGDTAGRRAAWRALENSLGQLADGKQVCFLFLPQGEDPDSYVRTHGRDAFEALVGSAVPLSRYMLDQLSGAVDLSSAEGRASLVHSAKPLVTHIPDSALRVQIVRELAERARLAPTEVETLCGLRRAPVRAAPPARGHARVAPALWRSLVRLLVDMPELADSITAEQRALLELDEAYAPVLALIDELRASGARTTAALIESTRGSPHAELYSHAAREAVQGAQNAAEASPELEGIFRKLEQSAVEGRYRALLSKEQKSESERLEIQQLLRRLGELKGVIRVGERAPT
jgi:DNA primase